MNSSGWLALNAVGTAFDDDEFGARDQFSRALPLTSNGTIASESPWITRVGTVTFATSARKSVRPKAVMQSAVPLGDANAPMSRA